jgi:hypothetical protein
MPDISVRARERHGASDEPSGAELKALEYEAPVIAAEMALLAAETSAMDTPGCPKVVELVNRARWRVIAAQAAVIGMLARSLVGAPPDYGEAG